MIRVRRYKDEDFEDMLKRFKTVCRREGLISEVRSRKAYEKPCDRRRRKHYESIAKAKKYRRRYSFG